MIQEDFEQHVVKLQNALLGFAKSLTHNEDEAKDLLQETSLKALSNKAMYDDSGSIKSWLYTIMRNLFLNCRRHSSRQESLPTDFEIPDTDDMQGGIEGEDSFSTIDVQRIMDLLSIDNRILFGLYLQGYRYDEIADRIIKDADRGVTVLDGTGWYSKANVKVLVVLAKKRQSLEIFRLVKRIDPNAFISQSSVIGVYGEGFDRLKVK
mgnify:CR=1 FL=1